MPECTDSERKMLDNIAKADVMVIWIDSPTPSHITFLRGFEAPLETEIKYGWVGEDGKSGDKYIRHATFKLGVDAKTWRQIAANTRAEAEAATPEGGDDRG